MMNIEMLKAIKEMYPNATMDEITALVKAMSGKGTGTKRGSEAASSWEYKVKEVVSKDGKSYKLHCFTFDGAVSDEVKKVLHYDHFDYDYKNKEWTCFFGSRTDCFIDEIKQKMAELVK